ncbi:hypothetical protein V5O48_009596 [Marasmius crinis-equi]|uniref:Uncharacterized protein n=1 Tax=Marasmius crinis-equi TaxID=585013 RepID=A0ABR3FAQ7_9AGAR
MPRRKLYHTKAQLREANRIKNRRFYDKNRAEILDSRRVKRETEQKAQEELDFHWVRHQRRRKKREKAKAKSKKAGNSPQDTEAEQQYPARATLVGETRRDFEERLRRIQETYLDQIKPSPRNLLDKLCQDSLRWKNRARCTIRPRETHISPVAIDRECLQTMLDEHTRLSREYFVLFEGEEWVDWDKRWGSLTEFEDTLSKMIGIMALIEVELEMEDMPTFEDLTSIYDSI